MNIDILSKQNGNYVYTSTKKIVKLVKLQTDKRMKKEDFTTEPLSRELVSTVEAPLDDQITCTGFTCQVFMTH